MDPYPSRYAEQFGQTHHSAAWQLIKSYWQLKQRLPAYLFLGIALVTTAAFVALDVVLTYWYYYFYDVLQAYDKHGAERLLTAFSMMAAIYGTLALYRFSVTAFFGMHWCHWLTEKFIDRFLQKDSRFSLETMAARTGFSLPRIHQDVGAVINFSIELSVGLIAVITSFLMLLYYLWLLSDELCVSLGAWYANYVSGYVMWVGLFYALAFTFFSFKFGRRQKKATQALPYHKAGLVSLHSRSAQSPQDASLNQKLVLWFSVGYNQTAILLPLLVALPGYFDKVFLIGWFIQSLQAFNRVQGSLPSIVVPSLVAKDEGAQKEMLF